MGVAATLFLIVGLALAFFGLAGLNAYARRWGDEDVTQRDYLVYGATAMIAGVGLIVVIMTRSA